MQEVSRYFYTDHNSAANMAKQFGMQFETEQGQWLEYYDFNKSFRYAHPTLDQWVYHEGPLYVRNSHHYQWPELKQGE